MDDIKALREALEAQRADPEFVLGLWEVRECIAPDTLGEVDIRFIEECRPARIARLLERLEKAERDAARWRAMRDLARCNSIDGAAWVDFGRLPWPVKMFPNTADYADDAIDTAMKEPQQ